MEDYRSQQGYIICIAPADVVNLPVATIHPISWSSTIIKRVCRSTLHAETTSMTRGIEAGTRWRAAIVEMKGNLDIKSWEESAASQMGHVWMTDCESLYEHLISPKMNSIDNKRLAIDLMSLRQLVWERRGERQLEIDRSSGDYPRWIDTSVMIADPLTKVMKSERLEKTLSSGQLDLRPTAESLMIKERSRQLRKAAKDRSKDRPKGSRKNDDQDPIGT